MKAQKISSRTTRTSRKDAKSLSCNLSRFVLFLEVFVDKDIPQRSLK